MTYAGMGVHDEIYALLETLAQRTTPLDVTLKDYLGERPGGFDYAPAQLVAAQFNYDGSCDVNLTLMHPQSDIHFGQNRAPRAWDWGIEEAQLSSASYEDLAEVACEYTGGDWEMQELSVWLPADLSSVSECFDAGGETYSGNFSLARVPCGMAPNAG
jgi:hypothetical protein